MQAKHYYRPQSVSVTAALTRDGENPTLLEMIRRDQDYAASHGFPVPDAVRLMVQGIRDGLAPVMSGNGNRARRKMCNPRGWDVVDTACPDCLPAAPAANHHLNCA